MTAPETLPRESYPDRHHDVYFKTIFGFWVYLLTDFMMFAVFFATYAVLRNNTYGGPSAQEILSVPYALVQTLILLVGSLTIGLGGASAHRREKNRTMALYGITFFLGILFMGMELSEWVHLISEGSSWKRSAFLSAYFTLVGMHGLHMVFGLLWFIVLLPPVWIDGLLPVSIRRLTCLRMFWQFLNIIWVLIFTIVYLMGASEYA
ncbi:MAG: cytochrome c oxidase subunit 3 [Waddliaceae bacterium]